MTAHSVILGDWGGTRLRLWLRQGGATIAASEAPGLLVANESPEQILRHALGSLGVTAPLPIVLCGMAGAREGLAEAGYVPCPGNVDQWVGAAVETSLDGFPITILPGFSNRDGGGRPDVMRGEEAQVFGALTMRHAGAKGPTEMVLPGTHSKWVRVEDCSISHFATCPTGELHASLLGSSLAPRERQPHSRSHADGFSTGVARAFDGVPLMASLFEARAARVLDHRDGDWSAGFLSGLLIGSEIAAKAPSCALNAVPLLVGSDDLVRRYRSAFAMYGLDCQTADGETCALIGLEIAYAQLG